MSPLSHFFRITVVGPADFIAPGGNGSVSFRKRLFIGRKLICTGCPPWGCFRRKYRRNILFAHNAIHFAEFVRQKAMRVLYARIAAEDYGSIVAARILTMRNARIAAMRNGSMESGCAIAAALDGLSACRKDCVNLVVAPQRRGNFYANFYPLFGS